MAGGDAARRARESERAAPPLRHVRQLARQPRPRQPREPALRRELQRALGRLPHARAPGVSRAAVRRGDHGHLGRGALAALRHVRLHPRAPPLRGRRWQGVGGGRARSPGYQGPQDQRARPRQEQIARGRGGLRPRPGWLRGSQSAAPLRRRLLRGSGAHGQGAAPSGRRHHHHAVALPGAVRCGVACQHGLAPRQALRSNAFRGG
mmetsp:Transcript_20355/g.54809  ORF Transcript_20355/g.54809 Transcript_20355/m.54809 type:complete len:206 (+) Transcript_20355:870-1487(+)